MLLSSIFSFLHFIAAFGVIFSAVNERLSIGRQLTINQVKHIRKLDSIYTISAVLVLIIGFMRVFLFENGKDYYYSNFFFWAKIGVFTVVGLLRIYPSIRFSKWKKMIQHDEDGIGLGVNEYAIIKRSLNLQITGLVIMMLAASLMAKGIDIQLLK